MNINPQSIYNKVEEFTTFVSDRLQVKALEYVNSLKENKSKMSELEYNKIKMQEYFTWPEMSTKHKL